MSKSSNPSAELKPIQFAEELMEESLIEWLSRYRKYLVWASLAFFLAILLTYRLINTQTLKAETDFFSAQIDFNRFQEQTLKAENQDVSFLEFQKLDSLIQRHPELHAKYDGPIAQTFLITQQPELAQPFVDSLFKRTQKAPVEMYQQYAQGSLLISEERYEEALANAKGLKVQMEQQAELPFKETLYVFNLIRLASLYQQLGQQQEEWQTWQTLQSYQKDLNALVSTYQLFRDEHFSLHKYIEERKKALDR